jgi:hypothetical protein
MARIACREELMAGKSRSEALEYLVKDVKSKVRGKVKFKFASLMNWPPSRGPMPKWMSASPRYRIPEPKIELLPIDTKPPRKIVMSAPKPKKKAAGRGHKGTIFLVSHSVRRSWDYRLSCHVDTLASISLAQANYLICGMEFRDQKPAKRKTMTIGGKRYRPQFVPLPAHLGNTLSLRTFVFDLTYPLNHTARVTIEPYELLPRKRGEKPCMRMTLAYVLWQLARAYKKIYKQHRRWGIWGHAITDLWFERLEVKDNIGHVGIGS